MLLSAFGFFFLIFGFYASQKTENNRKEHHNNKQIPFFSEIDHHFSLIFGKIYNDVNRDTE